MTHSLDDYATVAERLAEFHKKHPKGALRRIGQPLVLEIGGKHFITYTAGAWRDAATEQPDGIGTAWEPVPGPTQFTRDSELMNAETAAWGRAIVACGAATASKGIATQEDVRNRSQSSPDGHQQAEPGNYGPDSTPASSSPPAPSEGDTWPEMRDRLKGLRGVDLLPAFFEEVGLTGITLNPTTWAKLEPTKQKACIEAAENLLNPTLPVG